MEARKKHVYIAANPVSSKIKVYCLHPDDRNLERKDKEKAVYRCQVWAGLFMTDDDREAKAFESHENYSKWFIKDVSNLPIENRYGDNQPLADKLKAMKIQKLRSVCHQCELQPWGVLKGMTLDSILDLMINKKEVLAKYGVI